MNATNRGCRRTVQVCELCIAVCPKDCLEHAGTLNRYGVYPVRMKKDAACIGCSQCAIMCPDTAIEVYRTVVEEAAARRSRQREQG